MSDPILSAARAVKRSSHRYATELGKFDRDKPSRLQARIIRKARKFHRKRLRRLAKVTGDVFVSRHTMDLHICFQADKGRKPRMNVYPNEDYFKRAKP